MDSKQAERIYLELNDSGSVVAYYCPDTFELLELSDWNGNDVHHRWERVALEQLEEMKQTCT